MTQRVSKAPLLNGLFPMDNPSILLSHNVKVDQGFHHELTGALLCSTGMDWLDAEYAVYTK